MCEGGYEPVGNRGTYATRSKVVENSHCPSNTTLHGKTRTLNEHDDDDDDGKVYGSELEGPNKRGKPLGRCKDRVKE